MRMSRRMGLLGGVPSLDQLFTSATVVAGGGNLGSNKAYYPSGTDTSTTYYLIVTTGADVNIAKIKNGVGTVLAANANTNMIWGADDTGITISTTCHGHAYLMMRFPNYSEAVVDSVLSSATLTRKAYRSANSNGSVTISSSSIDSNKLYLAAFAEQNYYTTNAGASLSYGSAMLSSTAGNAIMARQWSNTGGSTFTTDTFAYAHTSSNNVAVCRTQTGAADSTIRGGCIYEIS